jgi:hypothetical protein
MDPPRGRSGRAGSARRCQGDQPVCGVVPIGGGFRRVSGSEDAGRVVVGHSRSGSADGLAGEPVLRVPRVGSRSGTIDSASEVSGGIVGVVQVQGVFGRKCCAKIRGSRRSGRPIPLPFRSCC